MARLTAEERAEFRETLQKFTLGKRKIRSILDSLDEAEEAIEFHKSVQVEQAREYLETAKQYDAEIAQLRKALVNIRRSATFAEMKRHADRALEGSESK